MELYNSLDMPLSNDEEVKQIQKKMLKGEELTLQEKFKLNGRDLTISKIGNYECKKNCCYRAISEKTLQTYIDSGYIRDNRRTEFILGENNQGIDWYLGGCYSM